VNISSDLAHGLVRQRVGSEVDKFAEQVHRAGGTVISVPVIAECPIAFEWLIHRARESTGSSVRSWRRRRGAALTNGQIGPAKLDGGALLVGQYFACGS
jgi:hypothetical protein